LPFISENGRLRDDQGINVFQAGGHSVKEVAMIRIALFATLVFFVMSFASRPNAAVWYVAPPPLGSDSNPGTEAQPFATIQKGIDTAGVSDTVIVAQGNYTENISFGGKNIVLRSSSPAGWAVVRNTVVDGNQAGAAVTFAGTEDETCVLSGFTIRNGKGTNGGGVCGWTDANSTHAAIENNIIVGNSAQNGGGIGFCDGVIRNNYIYGNSARGHGGGVYKCDGVNEGNLIVGNSASVNGGGLAQCGGAIRNDTICQNSATGNGGGMVSCGGPIVNCILWGNTASGSPQQNHECFNLSYCCVQGGGGGEGGIADDPFFADPDGADNDPQTYEDNDYRLQADSPCVDRGTNEDWMWKAFDLDRSPRILPRTSDWTVDMGAYEYGAPKPIMITAELPAGVKVIWLSEPGKTYVVWSTLDLLSGEWSEEGTLSSVGSLTSWIVPDIASYRRKFYKVETR
jgi:hypothetical protein